MKELMAKLIDKQVEDSISSGTSYPMQMKTVQFAGLFGKRVDTVVLPDPKSLVELMKLMSDTNASGTANCYVSAYLTVSDTEAYDLNLAVSFMRKSIASLLEAMASQR
jgi:hypothetical protein